MLCISASDVHGQSSLRITAPPDRTVVSPGQTLTVKVAASPEAAFQRMVIIGGGPIGVSPVLTMPPWEFTIQIPHNILPRRYPLTADGATAPGEGATSDPITIVVERADSPVSLKAEPPVLSFRESGSSAPIRVVGTFADGSTADLAESTRTAFASSAPGIASVSAFGLVTAVAAGSARITISHGGRTAIVPVTVHGTKQ